MSYYSYSHLLTEVVAEVTAEVAVEITAEIATEVLAEVLVKVFAEVAAKVLAVQLNQGVGNLVYCYIVVQVGLEFNINTSAALCLTVTRR
jgi:Mg2+/Co2+ transporter CorB